MLQGLWQHCSTMPRFTIISIWSLKAYSATSLLLPATAPPAFGGRKPEKQTGKDIFNVSIFYQRSHWDSCWVELVRLSHPAEGPRLSWGCRRSLGHHRPGKGRPPGESHRGVVEVRQPASLGTIRPERAAERQTGATEPPCWRRAKKKNGFYFFKNNICCSDDYNDLIVTLSHVYGFLEEF